MLIKASEVVEKLYSGAEPDILAALKTIRKLDATGRSQLAESVLKGGERPIFLAGQSNVPNGASEPDVPFIALCIRKKAHLSECFAAIGVAADQHLDVLAMLLTVPEDILSNLVIPDDLQRQPVLTEEAFGLDFTAKKDSLSQRLHAKNPRKFADTIH
jgi:hypothetical protein